MDNSGRETVLHLVDLAGSERTYKHETDNQTIKESKNINLSLLTLTKVVLGLEAKMKNPSVHVPYRDSTLTRFLQQAFESGSMITMIFTLNFHFEHVGESIAVSKFAMRCRNIKIKSVAVGGNDDKSGKGDIEKDKQIAVLNELAKKTVDHV